MAQEISQKEEFLPEYVFQKDKFNVVADTWLCSSAEKDADGNKFDGAFPKGFLHSFRIIQTHNRPILSNSLIFREIAQAWATC